MKIDGDIAYIPLLVKNGARRMFAMVDVDDVDRVLLHRWRYEARGRTFYAIARSGKTLPNHHMPLHGFIAKALHGDRHDHINGDGLDCRKDNLRLASQGDNAKNRRKTDARWVTSRFKGVHLTVSGKWAAVIRADGTRFACGVFGEEVAAALAYDEAALVHHGAFAKTNRMLGLYADQVPAAEPSSQHAAAQTAYPNEVVSGQTLERVRQASLSNYGSFSSAEHPRPRS